MGIQRSEIKLMQFDESQCTSSDTESTEESQIKGLFCILVLPALSGTAVFAEAYGHMDKK